MYIVLRKILGISFLGLALSGCNPNLGLRSDANVESGTQRGATVGPEEKHEPSIINFFWDLIDQLTVKEVDDSIIKFLPDGTIVSEDKFF